MVAIIRKSEKAPFWVRAYRGAAPVRRWLNKYMTFMTDDLISAAYECRNPQAHNIGLWFGTRLRRLHKNILKGLESEVVRMRGVGKDDGQPLSLLYIGDETNLKYLTFSVFADVSTERENLGRCYTRQMLDVATDYGRIFDLVVLERPVGMKTWPTTGEWFRAPLWVRMVKNLQPGTTDEQIQATYRKHQIKNIKLTRKTGLFRKISHDGEDFKYFYESMYVPSMKLRHGAYGGIVDFEYYQVLTRKGFLMWICLPDGIKVAGSIFIERHGVLYGVLNGFLNGDPQWLQKGALSAIYIFTYEYAVEKCIRFVDVGEVMPILTNGLYNHKKRWGFNPEISPWHVNEWLFWIPKAESPAWNWLEAHPFELSLISYHGDQIKRLVTQKSTQN